MIDYGATKYWIDPCHAAHREMSSRELTTERATSKFPNGDNFNLTYLHVTPVIVQNFTSVFRIVVRPWSSLFKHLEAFSTLNLTATPRLLSIPITVSRRGRRTILFDMRVVISRSCLPVWRKVDKLARELERGKEVWKEEVNEIIRSWVVSKFKSSLHLN